MIYTVTFNPSLDYIMNVPSLRTGLVNRSSGEKICIGGKGINVSCVLNELDMESVVLGFCAGFTGKYIKDGLKNSGIEEKLIWLEDGISRINVKLKGQNETEINGQGPVVSEADIMKLCEQINMLTDGDVLVLAGNTSAGENIYHDLLEVVKGKNVLTVVDATGTLLSNTLPLRPFMIKPNIHELSQLFNVEISSLDDVSRYASKLVSLGAQNVIVSMAEDGAILVNRDGSTYCKARKGTAVNSTGAGDSLVAGFIYKYITDNDIEKAFRFAVETGTVAAFSEGLPVREDLNKIEI